MLDLPQPWAARHQLTQFGFRAVGRAVVDVDDLKAAVLAERGRDLVDQGGDVAGLVPHRNDDRNSWHLPACKRFAHGLPDMAASRPPRGLGIARASYGAISARATLLMRVSEGPGIGRTVPSAPTTKASPRAAYQSRTNSAPTTPATAPTMTSLGKCAVSTTRLTPMTTA